MNFLTTDTLLLMALFALPALMLLVLGLMVLRIMDEMAERRRRVYIPHEMEEKYIRKCFPKHPSDVLSDLVLKESTPHPVTANVRPLKVKARPTREEWEMSPGEQLQPKSHWN